MKRRGLFWAADRAKAAHNRAPMRKAGRLSANSVPGSAHGAAITEPHPRLSGCQPDGFTPEPLFGGRIKFV
jgi:hypothetical protein